MKIEEAVTQIQSRHYGEQNADKELFRLALVFSPAAKKFIH